MADLTTKKRDKLPTKDFGLVQDGERKFPMPDKSHAGNAKARASEMYNKGKITEAEKAKIDRKADKKLGEDKPKKKEYPLPPSRFQKKES